MKFSKLSQLFLVSIIGLLVATGLTACQLVSIDYVFVADSAGTSPGSAGQIETYAVDAHSGALRIVDPAVASGGIKPVAMAVSGNYYHLYVANATSKNVVHFTIADTGVLTKSDTITLPDTPVALAVSAASNFLYVVYGSSSATLAEYPLSTSGAIGALASQQLLTVPGFSGDSIVPTGVALIPNNNNATVAPSQQCCLRFAYDSSAYNPGGTPTSTANPGWVFGFIIGSNGALTPTGSSPYKAGVKPSGITADPVSRFVYVTDFASNQLIGYLHPGLAAHSTSWSTARSEPATSQARSRSILVDSYIYNANSLDSTIGGYTISLPNGTPSSIVSTTQHAGLQHRYAASRHRQLSLP